VKKSRVDVVVVSHTHWDREWYLTFQQFRYQLVKSIDCLLDILTKDEDYVHFMLDGQTVVLEDYLEICPDKEIALKKHIGEGRISIGPWYVQPDEFLVSGESLIRNLLLGRRSEKEFGRVMPHGYLPDSFGHISQMPQILQGFGMDTAFIMRGVDDKADRTEFYWEAPDGTRVLAHYLLAGYGNAANLKPDPEAIDDLRALLLSKASTDTLLLMNGGDHRIPQAGLTKILKSLNEKGPDRIIHGTLSDFIEKVKDKKPKLGSLNGELRDNKRHPILSGTLSTRIYLKQMNAETQTLLERYAEPISALAWSLGADYPKGPLNEAWRILLRNHAHDSICGCGIDQVHTEMASRFGEVHQIAGELIKDGLRAIGRRTESDHEEGEIPILVFNPSQWRRTDEVRISIEPAINYPYGILSEKRDIDLSNYVLKDPAGEVISFKIEGEEVTPEDVLNGVKWGKKKVISFRAEDIPPLGYRLYKFTPGSMEQGDGLAVDDKIIENEFYGVRVQDDGALIIKDKATGETYTDFNYFEDSGDAGDEYNYSPPKEQEIFSSKGIKADIRLVEDGIDRATIRILQSLGLPRGLGEDRTNRSKERVDEKIASFVTLQKGVRRIDIRTIIVNLAKDHRLRTVFSTGIKTEESAAESAFDVVRRPARTSEGEDWTELPSPTHPQGRFVTVADSEKGVAILNKGLPEYEVTEDGKIHLTLLRCVGWLSRDDLQTRIGHAGPGFEAPGAQCPGEYEFEYSILPYSGTWESARIYKQALDFNAPLVGSRIEGTGKLPQEFSFLSVVPDELLISAIKRAEEDNSLIVRLYNTTDRKVEGFIKTYKRPRKAEEMNLNEESQGELTGELNTKVPLAIKAFEIKTIKLTF
jgi:mannosylglycerate hydrolase